MAVKDHTLDDKIIKSAKAEFLEHGFRGASLRQIAKNAGLSTGALYTRYENKDVLFCSLVKDSMSAIKIESKPMEDAYMEAQKSKNPEKIMEAIKKEEEVYLKIMFEYYDECILFFCRSDGSSIQKQIDSLMALKAKQTVNYLKEIAKKEVDLDGIEFILSEQFHYYKQILLKGYDKEKAISCLKTVENFMEAGWRNLFQEIL